MRSLKIILFCLLLVLARPVMAGPVLDLAILVDASGSLGNDGFAAQQTFIQEMLNILPEDNVRIGIIQFATGTETIYTFEDDQDRSVVSDVVADLDYTSGFTNTVQALIDALDLFEAQSHDDNLKSILLLTDGKPQLPNNGDENVCALTNNLLANDIQTSIIGTGALNSPDEIDCLLQDLDDYVAIDDFSGPTPGLQAQLDQLPSLGVPAPSGFGLFIAAILFWGRGKNRRS